MDGNGSAGNPNAATSVSLPAHTNEETVQLPDWISASKEDDGLSRELVSLLQSQKVQSPAETQQTAEEPDQLGLTKHNNHKDSPTEEQKPGDSTTKSYQLKPNHLPTQDQKLRDSPATEKQKIEDCSHTDQPKPAKPDQINPDPHPAEQQKLEDSSMTDKKGRKDSQPNPDQLSPTKPDSLHTDQKKPGDPLSTKHEQNPITAQEHQTHEDPCFTHQKTEEPAPAPPLKDLTSTFEEQNQTDLKPHLSESKDQQHPQDPPSENLTVITPERHQAPPPPHLNTQQAHPPVADQKNLSSTQVLPVHPTEASTLALPFQDAPLPIEKFCDQMQPCPPVSSSGDPKLCGFLLKQGGPLKAWKLRWFTYEDKKNQLFYYRTPQDVTPLGRVELCSASFTYPLKAEKGTFHIKTPERTFILKAVSQEVMLYWLQQLQVKRWQHRQMSTCTTLTKCNNTQDDFLPLLKSPPGLVGEEAANVQLQRTPLANVSIKHPLIEIQNSVHSLRKRSSQEYSQSVFHVEAPLWIPPNSTDTNNMTGPGNHLDVL